MLLGRIVEDGEPLWLREDTEAVLEFFKEKARLCSGCGLPREETMNPEAEGHYRSRALRCFACTARDKEAQRFAANKGSQGGLYFTVQARDEV